MGIKDKDTIVMMVAKKTIEKNIS